MYWLTNVDRLQQSRVNEIPYHYPPIQRRREKLKGIVWVEDGRR